MPKAEERAVSHPEVTPPAKVTKKADTKSVLDLIHEMRFEFAKGLPKSISADRFVRVALTAVQSNPDLLTCSKGSILRALLLASTLGLELDPTLGLAYLVPREINKKIGSDWIKSREACFQLGYRGLVRLAMQSGRVSHVATGLRYEKDGWTLRFGSDPRLDHLPADGDRGDLLGAYAIIYLTDGGAMFDYMNEAEILKVGASSQSFKSDYSPWKRWPEEMMRKTVLRRVLKLAPLATDALGSVVSDEYREAGIPTIDDSIPLPIHVDEETGEIISPPSSSRATGSEKLKEKLSSREREPGEETEAPSGSLGI